jgi:hypothetical protein
VALNRFDEENDVHRRNHTWLRMRADFEVVTSPTALADHLARS